MENKYQEEETKNQSIVLNEEYLIKMKNKAAGINSSGGESIALLYILITPIFIIGLLVASFIIWQIIKDGYNPDFMSYLSWEFIPILVIAFILLLFSFLWLLLTLNSKLNYVIKSIKNNDKNKGE